jgi:DNA-binding LytR/AlgR family response regulator
MVNGTLKSVLGRIDTEVFFQANRTQAINLDYVTQVEDGESGLVAVLANGVRVEMSRRKSSEFRRLKAI